MLAAVTKGVGIAALAGAAAFWSAPAALAAPAATVSFFGAFIYYARVWIQGYYFDARYTACAPDLSAAVALVTGGTIGGLGYASAEILAGLGATVVITVRSRPKGEAAVARLKRSAGHERVSYVIVDFTSCASIDAGAKALESELDRLDYLVLNAGVASGAPPDVWMTNHVGPFMLAQRLTSLLISTARAHGDVRAVAVSSGAHRRAAIHHDDPWAPGGAGPFAGPYGQSKLAQIMHMREWQRRLRATPGLGGERAVRCLAVTPGMALTGMTGVPAPLYPLLYLVGRSAHIGAQVVKMACIDEGVRGGSYLSNCEAKPSEGAGGCSNDPREWARLWATSERCAAEARARYP